MLMVNQLIGFGAGGIGGIDAFTVLMLHCDGADAATTFTDSSTGGVASPHTVTGVGNAQIDTAQSKFGGASLLLDGTGDNLTSVDSSDWFFQSADFTIDLWVRYNALPTGTAALFLNQFQDASNVWGFFVQDSAGTYRLSLNTTMSAANQGSFHANITTPTTGVWYHYAVERTGTTTNFYVDGVKQTTVIDSAWASPANITGNLTIGEQNASFYHNGWLDEIRLSKGVARYGGSNFTPPTEAYS